MSAARHVSDGCDWLRTAEEEAASWDDGVLEHVVDVMPYKPGRVVRVDDWVVLVAHVSMAKGEPPLATAERLASFVNIWRETYGSRPTPRAVRATQEETP